MTTDARALTDRVSEEAKSEVVAANHAATVAGVYLLLVLFLIMWGLFDTWVNVHSIPRILRYSTDQLADPVYHLFVYSMLGGALGGSLNGLRSFLEHLEIFKGRYIWKYILAPWMGAALGMIAYALIHSSISVLGGNGAQQAGTVDTTQALSNFAAGALAGYGARDVFLWLDAQVTKLFKKLESEDEAKTTSTKIEE